MAADEASAGRVGFVGLGNMGMPMSRRLAAAGYHVIGFDASAEVMRAIAEAGVASGADEAKRDGGGAGGSGGGAISAAPGLAGVADGVRAVILMLPDSNVVEQVLLGDGLLAGMGAGGLVIDMSSSDPARTRELAKRAAGHGVTLIDAPVSGGVIGAVTGSLTIMVGGPEEVFTAVRPMLAVIGSRVVHAGDVGAGHAVKALNNLLSAAHLIATSEALIAGQRFGLDPAVMLEIINGSSGRSASTENKWPRYVLTDRYDSGFPVRLMVKDLRLALGIERATGTESTVSEATLAAWSAAAEELAPDADHTEIARWVESQG
jgi:3-hydroxyisobutyrate dehydrogenase